MHCLSVLLGGDDVLGIVEIVLGNAREECFFFSGDTTIIEEENDNADDVVDIVGREETVNAPLLAPFFIKIKVYTYIIYVTLFLLKNIMTSVVGTVGKEKENPLSHSTLPSPTRRQQARHISLPLQGHDSPDYRNRSSTKNIKNGQPRVHVPSARA